MSIKYLITNLKVPQIPHPHYLSKPMTSSSMTTLGSQNKVTYFVEKKWKVTITPIVSTKHMEEEVCGRVKRCMFSYSYCL